MEVERTEETRQVSVIIPCFNEEATIERTLNALLQQTFAASLMEVFIIDGQSTDTTRAVIAAWSQRHPELRLQVLDNPARQIPHALNLGIAAATAPIILRMDAHAIPAKDYVARCVAHIQAGRADNVGGQWEVQSSVETVAGRAIAIAAGHPLGSGGASYRSGGEAAEVDTVPYGCFRAETLRRVGAYDESLLANEDYELNVRIRQSGGVVYFDPEIRCVYFSRPTYARLWQQYNNYGYWKARMARRYPSTLRVRQLMPPVLVLVFALSLYASLIAGVFLHPLGFLLLACILLGYAAALCVGMQLRGPRVPVELQLGVLRAIVCMHLAWGSGFLKGCLFAPRYSSSV